MHTARQVSHPSDSAPDGINTLRVLLLEDTPTDAELMLHALRRDGLSVVSQRVESESTFVESLETFLPDIVLVDFKLPTYDGLSAIRLVREKYPSLPVILVTGVLRDDVAADLIQAGAVNYVLKDNLARLPTAVRSAMAHVAPP